MWGKHCTIELYPRPSFFFFKLVNFVHLHLLWLTIHMGIFTNLCTPYSFLHLRYFSWDHCLICELNPLVNSLVDVKLYWFLLMWKFYYFMSIICTWIPHIHKDNNKTSGLVVAYLLLCPLVTKRKRWYQVVNHQVTNHLSFWCTLTVLSVTLSKHKSLLLI